MILLLPEYSLDAIHSIAGGVPMGYHISYNTSNYEKPIVLRNGGNLLLTTGIFFILFLLLVKAFWPEGNAVIKKIFWAGEVDVLNRVVKHSLAAMENGQAFPDAIKTFCAEMLYEAKLIG